MSKQNRDGSWSISARQLAEFNKGIDYTKLINNCLNISTGLEVKPLVKRVTPVESQVELDDDLKNKSFWNKPVQDLFKRK